MDVHTIKQLGQVGHLIQSSILTVVQLNETYQGNLPSKALFDAQRTLLATAGKLTELISEPSVRVLEMSSQYFEARYLHIAAEKRIPDILAGSGNAGVHVDTIAKTIGVESRKLYYLPRSLLDPVVGPSYNVDQTPFQKSVSTSKSRWEWLEEKVSVRDLRDGKCGSNGATSAYPGPLGYELEQAIAGKADDDTVSRPEHSVFDLAMLGGGKVFGKAHLYDYPWYELGSATVVDVGGGVGGFCIQLSHLYPHLKFIVEDRTPVLEQAKSMVWLAKNHVALEKGCVTFTPHDFFETNPVRGADVYWLRYILHDWFDGYCVQILSTIRVSMCPNSRVLIW
ncbi:hypothetical protein NX059_010538 [Plenodomus lindquistii]|nr:hypothetical protein NX059_010538 [Plenodomus lindquistii]